MNITEMLNKLNEDLARERGHMHFYLMAASTVRGLHMEEFSELFMKEAAGEMEHVKAFQDLIVGLSCRRKIPLELSLLVDPVVPCINEHMSDHPANLVEYALKMEDEVVANYVQRIEEAIQLQESGDKEDAIDGKYIELFLEKQIEDSRHDADELRRML